MSANAKPGETRMKINGSDRHTLRLFALDLPDDTIERFTREAGTGEWPLKYALGARRLRPGFVDTVRIEDLGTMALSQYMVDAHGATGEDFRLMRPQIDALSGHVVILPAQAFDACSQDLTIAAPLRHVGTFGEVTPRGRGAALRTASAMGASVGSDEPFKMPRLPWQAKLILGFLALAIVATLALIAV